ncbi:D-alanyl-D-alanine carboxypeptidase [Streptomyces longwoodensis]|uniref:D-alanyl-D-alanine carboxypeptidase n=1 Tax=Streptomyces longwoodensis TaxID=68231 RepID=UPI00340DB341
MAVARESAGARGGVDTATRVFSVREAIEETGSTGGSGESEKTGKTEKSGKSGKTGKTGNTGKSADAADTAESVDTAEAADTAESADASDAEGALRDAEGGSGRSGDAGEDSGAAGGSKRAQDASEGAEDASEGGEGSSEDVDGDAGTDTEGAADADTAPESDAADQDAPAEAGSGRRDAEEAEDERAEADTADDTADAPVDQPTAIFKAPRPERAVDQPTTMLKLGDAAQAPKGTTAPADKADAAPAPDGDEPAGAAPAEDTPGTGKTPEGKATEPQPTDAEPTDAEPAASAPEAAEAAEPKDAEPKDTASKDAEPERTEPEDATPKDATPKDAEPKGAEPKDAAPKGSTPEPDPERTSKFVALKSLDDPDVRKPKPAESTTVLRKVTPPATPGASKAPASPTASASATAPAPAEATTALPTVKPAEATAVVPQVGPERTQQQPVPPKPPLDLLAELTNTPPPPPTPLRTLARRIKIWTPLVILLVIVFAIVQAVRPLPKPELTLTAKDSFTFEGGKVQLPWPGEGQGWMDVDDVGTVDSFGKQTPVPIGSVAKSMTAYIVLKDHPLKSGEEGPAIPVDATAEKEGGYDADGESTLNTVKAGDTLTQKQALSAIMIPSANNIARLLARWDAGSETAFIKKMNDTAKELGMTNTTYTDASGLKETTVSTAEDQVKLGNELVKIKALTDITRLPEWTDPSGQKWRNYNTLVPYNHAIGLKTGSTTKAGGNLLFAATEEVGGETVTLVGAILGQHKAPIIDTVNAVSKTAVLAAQESMTASKILKKGDVVGYVDDLMGHHTPVVVTEDVPAVGWAGLTVKLSFAPADDLPHSAKAGTQVGTLTVGDGDSGAVKVPVALQQELTEPGVTDKLTRIG